MEEMKRESRATLIAPIVLLLLPVLYARSYLAIVVPGGAERDPHDLFLESRHHRVAALKKQPTRPLSHSTPIPIIKCFPTLDLSPERVAQ